MRLLPLAALSSLALAACHKAEPPPPPRAASEVMPSQQDLAKLDNSLAFVQAACGGCHAVEQYGLSPNPNSPTFAEIANRPWLSRESLSAWLRDAHNYPEVMDFDLTPEQADLVAGYMLTLRTPDHNPPI